MTTDTQYFATRWILENRETGSLTQRDMQGVIQDIGNLHVVSSVTQTLKSLTHAALCSHGIYPKSFYGLG